MNFTIYNKISGKITVSGSCQDLSIQPLLNDEEIIPVASNSENQYVKDGVIFDMPLKPNKFYTFDYITKQWIDTRTSETQWVVIRAERNQRLQATDWTQLADIPQETKVLWEPYRQALRDVTTQPDPFNIVWPTTPQ